MSESAAALKPLVPTTCGGNAICLLASTATSAPDSSKFMRRKSMFPPSIADPVADERAAALAGVSVGELRRLVYASDSQPPPLRSDHGRLTQLLALAAPDYLNGMHLAVWGNSRTQLSPLDLTAPIVTLSSSSSPLPLIPVWQSLPPLPDISCSIVPPSRSLRRL